MSEKLYIVNISYYKLALTNPATAMDIISNGIVVEQKTVNDEKVWVPDKNNEKLGLEVSNIELLRTLTVKEEDTLEAENARMHQRWAEEESARLKKQVEELKCQLKVAVDAASKE